MTKLRTCWIRKLYRFTTFRQYDFPSVGNICLKFKLSLSLSLSLSETIIMRKHTSNLTITFIAFPSMGPPTQELCACVCVSARITSHCIPPFPTRWHGQYAFVHKSFQTSDFRLLSIVLLLLLLPTHREMTFVNSWRRRRRCYLCFR
jgi:hypothetical protein